MGNHPAVIPRLHELTDSPLQGRRAGTNGNVHLEDSDALAALAEGQARCAVTGNAFAFLLQQQDIWVLQTVMCSAVVFSRMQVNIQALEVNNCSGHDRNVPCYKSTQISEGLYAYFAAMKLEPATCISVGHACSG